jgi:flagellar biosynthesis/type III secretory pathway protein FliH
MFTQEVNVDAMYRATTLLFGDQAALILAKLADTIDRAQQDAYEAGKNEGLMGLHDATETSFDVGYTSGYDQGFAEATMMAMGDSSDAEEARSEAYDDGYLHGVQDARANPALADENVQDIINDRADEHFEALDEDYGFDPSEYTIIDGDSITYAG